MIDEVHQLRDIVHADVCVLICKTSSFIGVTDTLGLAYVGASAESAFMFIADSYSLYEHVFAHELGHIVDIVINDQAIGSKKEPWNNVTYRNNSNWAGLTPSGSFISEHAKTSDEENYAESFEYGVTNGADNPYTGSKDGQVYKCLKAVFDDLVSFAGYGSRATQRMAGYLGIDISDKIAALQK